MCSFDSERIIIFFHEFKYKNIMIFWVKCIVVYHNVSTKKSAENKAFTNEKFSCMVVMKQRCFYERF